jgi:hypothetical protein
MSSRWTKNSAVQQPPPVCRKPPEDLPSTEPPFNTQTIQAYAMVSFQGMTPPLYLAATFPLNPELPDTTWENGTNYQPDNIAVEIFSAPPYEFFTVQLASFRFGIPAATHTWLNVAPQDALPWQLPFLEFDRISPPTHFEVKIRQ